MSVGAAVAPAALLLLGAAPAPAGDMSGIAVLVTGIFVGVPALLVMLGLIIASVAMGSRQDVRPGRRRYAWTAIAVTLALLVAFPIVSLILSSGSGRAATAKGTLALAAPALASVLLAARLLRRNRG